MNRNFHTDDFERLLREKSDEFRMYPSKRIWHSIYNNIHPGRKWPSVVMSITLITALLLMGYLNTNNTNLYIGSGKNTLQQKIIAQTNSPQFVPQTLINNPGNSNEKIGTKANNKTGAASNNNLNSDTNNKVVTKSSPLAMLAIIRQPSIFDDKVSN